MVIVWATGLCPPPSWPRFYLRGYGNEMITFRSDFSPLRAFNDVQEREIAQHRSVFFHCLGLLFADLLGDRLKDLVNYALGL